MALTASKTASWTIAAKRACANGLSPWPMSVLTVSSFQVRTTSARAEVAAVITASATRTARILVTIQILPFLLRAPTPPPRPRVNEFRNDGVHDSLPGAGNGPPSVAGLMRSEEPRKVVADRYRFSTFPVG